MHRLVALAWGSALLLSAGCVGPAPQSHGPIADSAAPDFLAPPARPSAAQPQAGYEAYVRPTQRPTAAPSVLISESTDRLTAYNVKMADLLCVAYREPERARQLVPGMSALRVRSYEALPGGRYDAEVRVPLADAARLRAALRRVLESTYGVRAQRVVAEADALVLVAPTGRMKPFLVPPERAEVPQIDWQRSYGTLRLAMRGDALPLLCEQLEQLLGQVVVDGVRVRSPYILDIQERDLGSGPARPSLATVRRALQEQLGLDLVPRRMPIEFVVIDAIRAPTAAARAPVAPGPGKEPVAAGAAPALVTPPASPPVAPPPLPDDPGVEADGEEK